jgi:hypothetical protein
MTKYLPIQILCQIMVIAFLQVSPAFANSDSPFTDIDKKNHSARPLTENGGTCKIQTRSSDNSEWRQFVIDIRNGEFIGNVSNVLSGSAPGGNDMLSAADVKSCRLGEVHTPDAAWLFASALIGFVGLSNKRRV